MKKILILFTVLAVTCFSFASTVVTNPPLNASEIFIPIGKTGQKISLLDLSAIKVKEFESLTGKHMNLLDKATFKLAQRKLRASINRDGTVNTKKFEKLAKRLPGETGFHAGGFLLGFFLGLIGVLIAYLINDDYKRNRVKWAWLGLLIAVVLNLIIIVALL